MSENTAKRPIRSFVRREGRMTSAQKGALESLWPVYGLEPGDQLIDFKEVFGREAPLVLEIGFGDGHNLLHLAIDKPDHDFIGIEVHRPGVASLMLQADKAGLANLKLLQTDAVEVLTRNIAAASLAEVLLFFPDPWPKARHHKRRIVSNAFAELVASRLAAGGHWYLATDWENYAEQMLEVAEKCNSLYNAAGDGQYAARPEFRPPTKFERRGVRLGHDVWDLDFIRKRSET